MFNQYLRLLRDPNRQFDASVRVLLRRRDAWCLLAGQLELPRRQIQILNLT